ncbi:MAG: EcsC family protein [Actinomycetes bacterium]
MARDEGRLSRTERMVAEAVERLVDAGIDGVGPLDPARVVAERARASSQDAEAAIDLVVASHTRLAAAGGFVTGIGGFVTMPVSLPVNVVGFYVTATRMVAATAHLRGYDLAQPEVRTAVLLALVGADADDLLAKAGFAAPGGYATRFALRRLPASALMMVNKGVAFRLLTQLGRRGLARLGRAVPFAGGAIGGALDAYLLRRIADAARKEFAPTA